MTAPIETAAGRVAAARSAILNAIAQADAAFRYSFNLTRLVEGEETHTLTMPGFDPVEFNDRDEGYALIAARRDQVRSDAILAALSLSAPAGDGAHADDLAVDRFAAKMKAKLAKAREKGRGGWDDPTQCSPGVLLPMFHEHVVKGDPVDVAIFAMMLEHHGSPTTAPAGDEEHEALLAHYASQQPQEADREIANDVLERAMEERRMLAFYDLVLIARRSREAATASGDPAA